MSLAYKVEELLALRDSVSESAVSIDKFANGDVIKEHVLRPSASASANLASRQSNRSLQLPTAIPPVPAAPQKRPSPSPSIKRGKAEKLLKEHGSPPGMRVTAGGRVVPSDLPPLGSSRFPDHTFRPTSQHADPGNFMASQTLSNNDAAARIEIVGGQPVIYIGDRMFALPAVNTNPSANASSGVVALDQSNKQTMENPTINAHGSMCGLAYGPSRASSTSPYTGVDLATLKAQQTLKKQELRTVEQTEVLQANHQNEVWRAGMIEKKRCLIVELDALRKSITALENVDSTSSQPSLCPGPSSTSASAAFMSSFAPHQQNSLPTVAYPYPPANAYTPLMVYQPPYSAFSPFPGTELITSTISPHSPSSVNRRSHAIEIKPPQNGTSKPALNPKSPTYEPTIKSGPARSAAAPSPSLPNRSHWCVKEELQPDRSQHRIPSQKPSLSSIDTTDFFPTDPHEHSSTRLAPKTNELTGVINDNSTVPSTPDKHWPASPWNEASLGSSRNNELTSKLTSWPEAFGKQHSSSSLRHGATGQSPVTSSERARTVSAYASASASKRHMPLQSDPDTRTDREESYPFSRKAIAHVPTTYQEGYQAGYDHVGVPDSSEVLQGYVQGLLHFLSDETNKGRLEGPTRDLTTRAISPRTPSLRGLVAGSLPHDSAISMSFPGNNEYAGNRENSRTTKDRLSTNTHRDIVNSPQNRTKTASGFYNLSGQDTSASRLLDSLSSQSLTQHGSFPERLATGRQVSILSDENAPRKPINTNMAIRANSAYANDPYSHQFSGTQLHNREYGTPLSSQRFYANSKEIRPTAYGREIAQTTRPCAKHSLSGLDGAMDDLAGLVMDTDLDDNKALAGAQSTNAPISGDVEAEEATASCFKPSGNKSKPKATGSPKKPAGNEKDTTVSSPHVTSSPKRSGEHSPAKAKLEHVTNKFRWAKKDDPRTMSPEDKMRRSEKWRQRFQVIKRTELEEIEEYRKNARN